MSSKSIITAILLILFLFGTEAKGQWTLKDSVKAPGTAIFRVDDLGSMYFVDRSQTITMIRKNGLVFTFNERSLGDVTNVDVSNPLKVLVHYGEANTLLILDNTLTQMGKITLDDLGVYGLNVVVGTSRLGGFWVFNPIEYNLARYDFDRSRIAGNQFNRNKLKSTEPIRLLERNGKVFLSFKEGKLLVFDINAVYLYQFPFPEHGRFQVLRNEILYFQNDSLRILNFETVVQKEVTLPPQLKREGNRQKACVMSGNRLYGIIDKKVLIFDMK